MNKIRFQVSGATDTKFFIEPTPLVIRPPSVDMASEGELETPGQDIFLVTVNGRSR
jgi:hypothetical protein